MTEVPEDKNNASPIDDAATAQAAGGYTFTAAGQAPAFTRNDKWAQEGVDHNLNVLQGPQTGIPTDAMQGFHAGASTSKFGANAFAGAGGSQTFHGPGGTSDTVDAGAFAGAHANATGVGAAAGAHTGMTFKVNENLSFGSTAKVGASTSAGFGAGSLTANAQAGASVETHIDAGIKGRLGSGLDGSTNTHIETGLKAEAGARASAGMTNKIGANAMAGDYFSVTQSGGLEGHGLGAKTSVGVITSGSAGVGTHAGLGVSDGKVNLNFGGALAVGIGGLTVDTTLSVDAKPLISAAKTTYSSALVPTGDAFKTAGLGMASGMSTATHETGNAFKTAGQGMASGLSTATHETGNAFNQAGGAIGTGAKTVGNAFKDAGGTVGNGFKDAGNAMGNGFADAGRSIASVFSHW